MPDTRLLLERLAGGDVGDYAELRRSAALRLLACLTTDPDARSPPPSDARADATR